MHITVYGGTIVIFHYACSQYNSFTTLQRRDQQWTLWVCASAEYDLSTEKNNVLCSFLVTLHSCPHSFTPPVTLRSLRIVLDTCSQEVVNKYMDVCDVEHYQGRKTKDCNNGCILWHQADMYTCADIARQKPKYYLLVTLKRLEYCHKKSQEMTVAAMWWWWWWWWCYRFWLIPYHSQSCSILLIRRHLTVQEYFYVLNEGVLTYCIG